jgi:hypothetical protein
MSWLGEYILPRHETLSRIYAAYRERYNYYSACGLTQSEIGALLPPPEYPLSPENMKSWMRLFADAVGRLLQYSLDLKKLGDWQPRVPFAGFYEDRTDIYPYDDIDFSIFFCKKKMLHISDRKIAETWYYVLNNIIHTPVIAQVGELAADGQFGCNGELYFKEYDGDTHSYSLLERQSVEVYWTTVVAYKNFYWRQWTANLRFENRTGNKFVGNWKVRTAISDIPTDVDMSGDVGKIIYPAEIEAQRQTILDYPLDSQTAPQRAELTISIGNIKEIFVEANNLSDPQYQYLD